LTKITNIFCAEIDKPSNPQRQVVDEEVIQEQNNDGLKKTDETDSSLNQRISETIEEGKRISSLLK
jgi:hypothetical protein